MKDMDIQKAKEFIKEKHANQKRKHGTPYYLHPLAVAELLKEYGFSAEYQIVGLFHDLIEDTDVTKQNIEEITNSEIATAVHLLSKEDGYKMDEYINRIAKNEMAKMVKIADRIHNLSEANLASIDFQKRYIEETRNWYLDLAKNTCFEKLLNDILEKLENNVKIN